MARYSASYEKDPDDQQSYVLDWDDDLGVGETIADSDWTVEAGDEALTIVSSSNTTTTATVWLAGGTLGTEYYVTNRITSSTTPARILDRTIRIAVMEH